ncbi:hypothetical protein A3762_13700 [Oleiphilus sp. HI0125]|uniref:DUF3291 domain-containing protein n=1 Tax=Oleiphilus sp. HI0125 TaxID=1822266 RepID=UPI0007C3226D|nr:DUF3291 domain-containing protein [Oleiphilus sp. HI0125]KZZ62134.1 hypothetical protein A3762_13700 [Oleiphilus sp. HI0125]
MAQLAQINIAYGFEEVDHPSMVDFKEAIDHINMLAERSEGFVWRFQTEEGDATAVRLFDDPKVIVNISVWESLDALKNYVYQGEHLDILKRKKEWFQKTKGPHLALWWIEDGEFPTAEQAKEKLEYLAKHGPNEHVFNMAWAGNIKVQRQE